MTLLRPQLRTTLHHSIPHFSRGDRPILRSAKLTVGIALAVIGSGLLPRSVPEMVSGTVLETLLLQGTETAAMAQFQVTVREDSQGIASPQALLAEINRVRTHPAAYAQWLETLRPYYEGTAFYFPDERGIQTVEGTQALDDAILALSQQSPLPPLQLEAGLLDATQLHLTELLTHNRFTLSGLDGSNSLKRAERYGTLDGGNLTQVLNQGFRHTESIVASLVIDDGNFTRSTRSLVLNPDITKLGTACGVGAGNIPLCVLDYVTQYITTDSDMAAIAPNVTTLEQLAMVESVTTQAIIRERDREIGQTSNAQRTNFQQEQVPMVSDSQLVASADPTFTAMRPTDELSSLAEDLVVETNQLRSNPAAYAEKLMALHPYYEGNLVRVPSYPIIEIVEGVDALEEAIAVLLETEPMNTLDFSNGMTLGAMDHVKDLSSHNQTGHYGSDGSDLFTRIDRYGQWESGAGENISYGPIPNAEWHIIQLLIDDNVPSRGHRKALLNPNYQATGTACASHPTFQIACVMTYADRYHEGS